MLKGIDLLIHQMLMWKRIAENLQKEVNNGHTKS